MKRNELDQFSSDAWNVSDIYNMTIFHHFTKSIKGTRRDKDNFLNTTKIFVPLSLNVKYKYINM